MNGTISAFLEELDPFWHFLAPIIVTGFLGCLFGVILSCLFCRPKAAPAAGLPEQPHPKETPPPPGPAAAASPAPAHAGPSILSAVLAAARPSEVPSAHTHLGNLGLLYHQKPQDADDLTLITGITAATAVRLRDLGIYRFDQISQWTPAIIDTIHRTIPGAALVSEENWVAQAKRLASSKAEQLDRNSSSAS